MVVTQKDLDGFKKVFEMLNKAKYDNIDGNEIISIYQSFLYLRSLEDRIINHLKVKTQEITLDKNKETVKTQPKSKKGK